MTLPFSAFARDAATAAYYDQRAAEYDDWYRGTGLFRARSRPGWEGEVGGLIELLHALPPARTLDVACGTGFLTSSLRGQVVALDRSAGMAEVARTRVSPGSVVVGDALRLPFPNHAFARVFTGHFYGHLPSDERGVFLAEAKRVARELVVVDTATRQGEPVEAWQERVLNDGSHHRVYKRFLDGGELAREIGGTLLLRGNWFVAARRVG